MEIISRNIHEEQALEELFQGRLPTQEMLEGCNGHAEAIHAMIDGFRADGIEGVQTVFKAMVKDNPSLIVLRAAYNPESTNIPRFELHDDEYFLNKPKRKWLISGILPEKGLSMVYGPPGGGKSLLVQAWAMCIASGTEWLNRKVSQGMVVYIAAEGGDGIGLRIKAWKEDTGFKGNTGVKWVDKIVLLNDASTVDEFIQNLKDQLGEQKPALIIADTLSRCSAGADENSNKEMSIILAAADRVREEFNCAFMVVHHDGKEKGRGPRGAQALSGNAEVVISVQQTDEGCKVSAFKVKDAKPFPDLNLKLHVYQFNPYDDMDTGAVLQTGSDNAVVRRPQSQETMLAVLGDRYLSFSQWKQECSTMGITENTFKDGYQKLNKAKVIEKVGITWGRVR